MRKIKYGEGPDPHPDLHGSAIYIDFGRLEHKNKVMKIQYCTFFILFLSDGGSL
jgi:hypothetical protein